MTKESESSSNRYNSIGDDYCKAISKELSVESKSNNKISIEISDKVSSVDNIN